jgi:hypothetical protein
MSKVNDFASNGACCLTPRRTQGSRLLAPISIPYFSRQVKQTSGRHASSWEVFSC